jgi:uncharacterized membrane protein YeiH
MYYLLEHFGVTVSAISGVLAARGKQVDLFGVLVLALVTALGGGTIRDLLLNHGPVFWIEDPHFLDNAAITAVITFFLVRFHPLPLTVLLVADAFSLALFTAIGTERSLSISPRPAIAITMGVTTGVAGGILRDLLTGQIPLVFQREIYLYATAAFCGAVSYVLLDRWTGDAQLHLVLATAVTLLLRLTGIRWRLALPVFRPKEEKDGKASEK